MGVNCCLCCVVTDEVQIAPRAGWTAQARRLTEQIFEACRPENTLTVVRVQLVSALGSAHGVLDFAHVGSHVSVRVVLDEQLASLRVWGQRWYKYFLNILKLIIQVSDSNYHVINF